MHPWEDWAETFAHYLHIWDTLQTAGAFGVDVRGAEDPAPDGGDFGELLDDWLPLTYALNALSRSMGRDDLYPFVLPAPVVEKLAFVHERVTAARHAGLSSPSGSSARLIAAIARSSPGVRTSSSQRALATPTPCSALIVPPHVGGQPQHRLVDRVVVGLGAEHVDVDVAVAEVAEEDHARAGRQARRPPRGTRAANAPSRASGTPTSILCGTPAAAIASVCASRRRHRRSRSAVSSATTRVLDPRRGQAPRRARRSGRPAPRTRPARRPARAVGTGAGHAEVVEHELQAVVEEELGGLERGQPRAHAGQQRGAPGRPTPAATSAATRRAAAGRAASARAVMTPSVPSLPTSSAGEVVAGVVLQQAGPLDDRAVGQHRLEPGDARARRAVAQRARPPASVATRPPTVALSRAPKSTPASRPAARACPAARRA